MAIVDPAPQPIGTAEPDDRRVAELEALVERLSRQQATGRIGYWAAYEDERAVEHYAYTMDPRYAELSPQNAVSRAVAVVAHRRALERYRATLVKLRER
jgi:hypothetical protein